MLKYLKISFSIIIFLSFFQKTYSCNDTIFHNKLNSLKVKKAIKTHKDDCIYLSEFKVSYYLEKSNLDSALKYSKEIRKIDSCNLLNSLRLGELYLVKNQIDSANRIFLKCANSTNKSLISKLGIEIYLKKELENLPLLQNLSTDWNNGTSFYYVHFYIIYIYHQLGYYDKIFSFMKTNNFKKSPYKDLYIALNQIIDENYHNAIKKVNNADNSLFFEKFLLNELINEKSH